jgi:hypothetical protein
MTKKTQTTKKTPPDHEIFKAILASLKEKMGA